jgi:hypothetical protein
MSFGLVELITLLMSLSGFSLQQNPKAATPDQALTYAMPDADFAVHLDASSVVGNNYKLLLALPNQPQIRASPGLSRAVKRTVNEVDGLKGLVKTTTGIDLTTDITDATMFVKVPQAGEPDVVLAVRGKFTTATIDRIAKVAGPAQAQKVGNTAMLELPPGQFPFGAIAVTKEGTLLAGGTALVKERLAETWKAPARPSGSNLAQVATVLEAKPVFAVAMTLSPTSRARFLAEFKGEKNFITDVIKRHKLGAFSMFRDGIGWTWIDSTRQGLDAMAQISEGSMDMLRAAHVAPRGFAKIMLGALESYRGKKDVDELLKRKADLWKIVESYTGDGNFKVAIDKNPATLRLTARATGKSLSDVLPAGILLPTGMFLMIGKAPSPAPPMIAPTPAPAQPPRLSPKTPPAKPTPRP